MTFDGQECVGVLLIYLRSNLLFICETFLLTYMSDQKDLSNIFMVQVTLGHIH